MTRAREPVRVRAERIQRMVHALRARPRRVPELAKEFGVHRRTVYRDLEVIARIESGFESHEGEHWLPARAGLVLNMPEALGIYSAARLLVNHARIVDKHYVSVLRKLVQAVREPARSRLAEAEDLLPSSAVESSRTLELAAHAWFEQKLLRFDYWRNPFEGSPTQHHVEVYHYEISPVNLAGYVIGHSRERNGTRTFKTDRIRDATLLSETFEVPSSFDPRPYLLSTSGILSGDPFRARLWCHPSIAMHIEEFDHRGIEIEQILEDRGLVFTAPGARTDRGEANELKSWIESWGPKMKVLEPEWLRKQVMSDLREAAALYE